MDNQPVTENMNPEKATCGCDEHSSESNCCDCCLIQIPPNGSPKDKGMTGHFEPCCFYRFCPYICCSGLDKTPAASVKSVGYCTICLNVPRSDNHINRLKNYRYCDCRSWFSACSVDAFG